VDRISGPERRYLSETTAFGLGAHRSVHSINTITLCLLAVVPTGHQLNFLCLQDRRELSPMQDFVGMALPDPRLGYADR